MITHNGVSSIIFYREQLLRLDKNKADSVQLTIDEDPKDERFLNIGLIRSEMFFGFYMNLTAWEAHMNRKSVQKDPEMVRNVTEAPLRNRFLNFLS